MKRLYDFLFGDRGLARFASIVSAALAVAVLSLWTERIVMFFSKASRVSSTNPYLDYDLMRILYIVVLILLFVFLLSVVLWILRINLGRIMCAFYYGVFCIVVFYDVVTGVARVFLRSTAIGLNLSTFLLIRLSVLVVLLMILIVVLNDAPLKTTKKT